MVIGGPLDISLATILTSLTILIMLLDTLIVHHINNLDWDPLDLELARGRRPPGGPAGRQYKNPMEEGSHEKVFWVVVVGGLGGTPKEALTASYAAHFKCAAPTHGTL